MTLHKSSFSCALSGLPQWIICFHLIPAWTSDLMNHIFDLAQAFYARCLSWCNSYPLPFKVCIYNQLTLHLKRLWLYYCYTDKVYFIVFIIVEKSSTLWGLGRKKKDMLSQTVSSSSSFSKTPVYNTASISQEHRSSVISASQMQHLQRSILN